MIFFLFWIFHGNNCGGPFDVIVDQKNLKWTNNNSVLIGINFNEIIVCTNMQIQRKLLWATCEFKWDNKINMTPCVFAAAGYL